MGKARKRRYMALASDSRIPYMALASSYWIPNQFEFMDTPPKANDWIIPSSITYCSISKNIP